MRRLREIDLEAPVREDDDGENDGYGDGTGTSVWNERFCTKKSRWAHTTRLPEASLRDAQTGNWPSDVGHSSGTIMERGQHPGITDIQVGLSQEKEIQVNETTASTTNPKPFVSFDLHSLKGSAESAESRGAGGHIRSENETMDEVELNVTGKGRLGKVEKGEQVEEAHSKEYAVVGQKNGRTSFTSPAFYLYSINNPQCGDLYTLFEEQAALLTEADASTRLKASRFMASQVKLINEGRTRILVVDMIKQHLWNEEEPSVIQSLVQVLCSVAITCPDDTKEARCPDVSPSKAVTLLLLQYIKTKEVSNSTMKSGLKLQILRSLCQIGTAGDNRDLDCFRPFAKEQLGSSNPRLRQWGIRLLVKTVRDRNASTLVGNGDVDEINARKVLGSWKEGEFLMFGLLEYTRDPCPSVREAAVNAILELHGKGFALNSSTYKFAVALLQDFFESVRICAIKLVGVCVKAAPWDVFEGAHSKYVNHAFLWICNMMTDMTMGVRQEACNALANMSGVSDNVMLQSLSKKVLATVVMEKESTAGGSISKSNENVDVPDLEGNKLLDWCAAGAFVVGLEDEFWEVRSAAVKALAKLGISSERMAQASLELIVDMINDDSSYVREQTLYALTNLASVGHVAALEAHLHMFLGILEDTNMEMRKAGHKLLSVISLPGIATFQLTIRAIFTSLEKHPEDEESLLEALENLGRFHASHTECIATDLLQELRGLLNGESGLDEPRCTAILVLLLAAASSNVKIISLIPYHILSIASLFSYKLPSSLPSLQMLPMGFKTLQYAWSMENGALSSTEDTSDQSRKMSSAEDASDQSRKSIPVDGAKHMGGYSSPSIHGQESLTQDDIIRDEEHQQSRLIQSVKKEVVRSAGQIVAHALGVSSLLELEAFKVALQRLSGCRQEVTALKKRCLGLNGTVSFCELYVECLILVVHLRAKFVSRENGALVRKSSFAHELLNKLDSLVRHLLHRFLGFNRYQLLQVYELQALVSVWKLSLYPVDLYRDEAQTSILLKRLLCTVKALEKMRTKDNFPPSILLDGVQEHFFSQGKLDSFNTRRVAHQLAFSYWPSRMPIEASLKEMWAEIKVAGSNFDQPILFNPDLPLGIPLDVKVFNVPDTSSLWVQFCHGKSSAQYKFLDVERSPSGSSQNMHRLSTVLQLERMQTVALSMCRICIILEGADHEDIDGVEATRGPQGPILPLCVETEVHLVLNRERVSKQLPPTRR